MRKLRIGIVEVTTNKGEKVAITSSQADVYTSMQTMKKKEEDIDITINRLKSYMCHSNPVSVNSALKGLRQAKLISIEDDNIKIAS